VKRDVITNAVIVVVVLIWSTSVVAGMVDHAYQIPGTVQLIMVAVATFLFGNQTLRKAQGKVEDAIKKYVGKRGEDGKNK
jgi:hypothetical protein